MIIYVAALACIFKAFPVLSCYVLSPNALSCAIWGRAQRIAESETGLAATELLAAGQHRLLLETAVGDIQIVSQSVRLPIEIVLLLDLSLSFV